MTDSSMNDAPHDTTAVLFIVAMLAFVQAFLLVKVACLALFLCVWALRIAKGAKVPVHLPLLVFYLITAIAGIVWAIVGLLHPRNFVEGITGALRLYVMWSLAFLLIYSLLRARASFAVFHRAMVLSAVLIAAINLFGVADLILGLGLIPERVRTEMELYVAVKDGYVQITSNNIGALFLVTPYLMAVIFRKDAKRSWTTTLALALALLTATLSGRRALWIVIALTPCTMLLLSLMTGTTGSLRLGRTLYAYVIALGLGGVLLATTPENAGIGYIAHIQDAFSSTDERTLQAPHLINGFLDYPVLGSGFGAYAGYLRNEDRPWTYELTYHRMLFNMGLVGMGILVGLFGTYLALAIRMIRRSPSAIPFGLLVAFVSLLVGAYSNSYFGSFDYLFFVGLLPYLASFHEWDHFPTAVKSRM